MSDAPQFPVGFEPAEQRRERMAAQVRRWCEQHRLDGRHAPLSDAAALCLAAGRLDDETRDILARRRRIGRGLPTLGGFGALRHLTDEHARLTVRAADLRPGAARLVFEYRAGELAKRLRNAHYTLTVSGRHYAQGVRAVRRERRDGVHLDPHQRDALFAALQHTPAPVPEKMADQVRGAVLGVAVDRVTRWSDGTAAAAAGRRAADALGRQVPDDDDHFVDRYDTLLFLAGTLYDRIEGSTAWRSEHLAVQRSQLDLADELTQIAVDTVTLRGLLAELADARRAAPSARAAVDARIAALEPVWDQLLDRVAALARIGELLTVAEMQLRTAEVEARTASLDERIDSLIGRSGARELSADNTHFVGDQFGIAAELMGSLRSELHGDIAELTARE
ncbi:hypothetical protein KI427_08800 [Rhodococcus ruber]|uniref:hypothetical protein n=1 Tax=Rhodococcus TaxID=1827 RepID=UPI000E6B31DC|nr:MULTISPECIES: hypothetical protein [Rhodococcus]MDX5311033.1 hypothetical protein [Rhodococcus sp. (in: high G+C Gram-positive bacteria)]AXY51371.1 hypothetical protein YT1_1937 [Rhodococcus ruber]MDO1477080.1 hypothetical protein [Rhodococcus ruber]MDX5453130.1 hypothetical protein [Rhodococcus sp. (in: high G+C Gram-positive bacteria)]UQB74436.1 hypothetical protein KI427_08800 [Rhodococcus ruber]